MLTKQTQNICITFVQRRPNVFDGSNIVQMLYKCFVFTGKTLARSGGGDG